ncbi:MAG: hypothetical protein ABWK01_08690 [Infirmifilum sp.]
MMIVIQKAIRSFLSPNPLSSYDKFAHAVANSLAMNSLSGPVFELKGGELEISVDAETLVGLTGNAEIIVDERNVEPWAAYLAKKKIYVKTGNVAYVSIRGLHSVPRRKQPVRPGESYRFENLNGVDERDLRALRVPISLRLPNGDWLESVARIQRHLGLVLEAARKGAEQVKIRVSGGEFEAWVLELA